MNDCNKNAYHMNYGAANVRTYGSKIHPGRPNKNTLLPLVLVLAVAAGLAIFGLTSCNASTEPGPLRVAQQFGIGYLPLAIIQTEGLMESIQWSRLSNATAIREAMAGGRLDIGFMGIPPFLLGVDRGTGWQIFSGLSQAPLGLVTLDPTINTLQDLAEQSARPRIALPQPGSIQHILLAMAAERELGNPTIFDNQLVSLGHPEGLAALATGREIGAHFTASPFLEQALTLPQARLILSGIQAFGSEFTFLVGVRAPGWGETQVQQRQLQEFTHALSQAMEIAQKLQQPELDQQQRDILKRVADFYGLASEDLHIQLVNPSLTFETQVRGLEQFIAAMDRFGYVDQNRLQNLQILTTQ
jgi:NitT/TauT family transport system substrate-binding protein